MVRYTGRERGYFFYDAKIQKIIIRWVSIRYVCFDNLDGPYFK